jgi:hypothetical protein
MYVALFEIAEVIVATGYGWMTEGSKFKSR